MDGPKEIVGAVVMAGLVLVDVEVGTTGGASVGAEMIAGVEFGTWLVVALIGEDGVVFGTEVVVVNVNNTSDFAFRAQLNVLQDVLKWLHHPLLKKVILWHSEFAAHAV